VNHEPLPPYVWVLETEANARASSECGFTRAVSTAATIRWAQGPDGSVAIVARRRRCDGGYAPQPRASRSGAFRRAGATGRPVALRQDHTPLVRPRSRGHLSNVKHYRHAKTVTDYNEFEGRSHYSVIGAKVGRKSPTRFWSGPRSTPRCARRTERAQGAATTTAEANRERAMHERAVGKLC
jgi:hypothetical protein